MGTVKWEAYTFGNILFIPIAPQKMKWQKGNGWWLLSLLSKNNLTQLSFCNFFFHAKIMRPIC